jgi:acid phosphatase
MSEFEKRAGVDSLEPQYPCTGGQSLFNNIKDSDSASSEPWKSHLEKTKELMDALDAISDIPSDADDWHTSYDHYFDNLSSRLCHSKPLPCKQPQSNDECMTRSQANTVFRLGQWEYSRLYRDAPSSLIASAALYGVFIAELAQHLREQIKFFIENTDQTDRVLYRHNVAHDGSISRILSVLQIRQMIWPGMGAEIVFELYRKTDPSSLEERGFYVRVLWGGQVLQSSNPELGDMNFVDLQRLLDYFDSLVGQKAQSVVELCRME